MVSAPADRGAPPEVAGGAALREMAAMAQEALGALYGHLRHAGYGAPAEARGQTIRPLLSLAGARATGRGQDEAFWSAVAAVQLAHEASLLHDDVIDGAATRRSEPTLAASRGIAAALVEGDHLLTTAYRLAAATGSAAFVGAFAGAVERTVAGEKLQGRSRGRVLDEDGYRTIVRMKSGELLGCALAVAPLLAGAADAPAWYEAGRRLGTLYQMLDDLLDYCPATDTGKPPLGDYAQGRWTWPLLELPGVEFGGDPVAVAACFAAAGPDGSSPLRRCEARFAAEASVVRDLLGRLLPGDVVIDALVAGWAARVAGAVHEAETAATRNAAVLHLELAGLVAAADEGRDFFRRNSRSFSFAARLFPAEVREKVTAVYAFCRITDDLADADDGTAAPHRLARLQLWETLARQAYHGTPTALPLLDRVMADAAAAGVPFAYVEALVEGMRMDVRGTRYGSLDDLGVYCQRVAGVVGQWLTRLAGVHDDAVLEQAARLGRAMQLTNIIRDVGEDLARGRIYVPGSTLRAFGLDATELHRLAGGGPVPARYVGMLRHLMAVAEAGYRAALQATPALPGSFRFAVAAAAAVYRGIHGAVEANGFDSLGRRARTGGGTKLLLGIGAVAREILRIARRDTWQPATLHAAEARARVTGSGPSRGGAPQVSRTALLPVRAGGGRAAVLALAILVGAAGGARAQGPAHAATPGAVTGETPVTPAVAREWAAGLERRLSGTPADSLIALDLARAFFFVAVNDAAAVRQGRAALAHVHRAWPSFADAHAPLLRAYEGAFLALEARHGTWPHARLRAVRAGLRLMDAAVSEAPDDVEVRYLRLVNTHYMPGILGRGEGARADRAHVERLIAAPQPRLHPVMREAIRGFLRDTGR